MNKEDLRLYVVTDCKNLSGEKLERSTRIILENGATMVQYRNKDREAANYRQDAEMLQALCKEFKVPFVINDDVELALALDTDGVHVGQDDESCAKARELLGPDKIIGVSAHNIAEARKAKADGADYLGCGALFPTKTKDAAVLSKDELTEICESIDLPVVGIGGISSDNVSSLAGSGIDGVAVVSALYGLPNPTFATRRLKSKVDLLLDGQKEIKGVLFDVDGTLTDTLLFWQSLAPNYLKANNYEPGPDIADILADYTLPEAAGYIKHNYSVYDGVGDMIDQWLYSLDMAYKHEGEAKAGVKEFLAALKDKGIARKAYTISPQDIVNRLLAKTGLNAYLDGLESGWDRKLEANDAALFDGAAGNLTGDKKNVWVFEDSIFALRGAAKAGYRVAAIYDEHHKPIEWKNLMKEADAAFYSFAEAKKWLEK